MKKSVALVPWPSADKRLGAVEVFSALIPGHGRQGGQGVHAGLFDRQARSGRLPQERG